MIVKFTELIKASKLSTNLDGNNGKYILRNVFINPHHVTCVREDSDMKQLLNEAQLPKGLNKNHVISCVTVQHGHSGLSLTIVGSPDTIQNKLRGKELLHD